MLNVGAVVGMAGKQETAIPRKTDSARRNSSPHWWEDVEGWSSCLLEGPVTFNFHCGMCGTGMLIFLVFKKSWEFTISILIFI